VADRITQQITDALAKAAAHPDGLPLFAAKSAPGLFPNTAAARPAAQKAAAEQLIATIRIETRGKTTRDIFTLTDHGWDVLLACVNPKQVLEDFVRVLEERRGEVGELLDAARRMAESLEALRDAVGRVLPVVSESRVRVAGEARVPPSRWEANGKPHTADSHPAATLPTAIVARLSGWSGPTDCTLAELYRALADANATPTIGSFHDCLRRLHEEGSIYLHPWTGPLYAIPEPMYALLIGHGIAYYASLRQSGVGCQKDESGTGTTKPRLLTSDL
jgi:hypothetical protein